MSNLKNEPISVETLWEVGSELYKIKGALWKELDALLEEYDALGFADKILKNLDIGIAKGQIMAYQEVLDMLHPLVFRDENLKKSVEDFVRQIEELADDFEIDIKIKMEYGEDIDVWFVNHNVENIEENHPIFYKKVAKLMDKMFISKGVYSVCFDYDYELQ